jgi:hypothetical protein
MRRHGFHRQRRADAPFAAHRDAEQRAQCQQRGQARRETRRQLEQRITCDVHHQRRAAAEAIGEAAEDQRAERAHRERERERERDGGDRRCEFGRDVLQHEHHQEEIECVERPAEVGGDRDVALLASPAHVVGSPRWLACLPARTVAGRQARSAAGMDRV